MGARRRVAPVAATAGIFAAGRGIPRDGPREGNTLSTSKPGNRMALLPGDARLATQVESFLTPEDIMRISRRTACIVCRTPRDSHHGLPKPMHPSRRGSNAVWGLVALAMCLFPAPVLARNCLFRSPLYHVGPTDCRIIAKHQPDNSIFSKIL